MLAASGDREKPAAHPSHKVPHDCRRRRQDRHAAFVGESARVPCVSGEWNFSMSGKPWHTPFGRFVNREESKGKAAHAFTICITTSIPIHILGSQRSLLLGLLARHLVPHFSIPCSSRTAGAMRHPQLPQRLLVSVQVRHCTPPLDSDGGGVEELLNDVLLGPHAEGGPHLPLP